MAKTFKLLMRSHYRVHKSAAGLKSKQGLRGVWPRPVYLLLLLLLAASPAAWSAPPQTADQLKLSGYVSDFANVLSQTSREQLAALCTEVQQKTQAQIAVVTIQSLGGRPVEDYAVDLFARSGIGPKQTNRGVLILMAVGDRRYRIEVGYGLESILPDGKVGSFGREAVPYLRQNNYDAALQLMTRRVADVIAADRGVTLTGVSPPSPQALGTTVHLTPGQIYLVFFAIFVVFSIIRRMGGGGGTGSRLNRYGGGGWWIGPMMGGGFGSGGGGFGGGGGGGFGGFGGGSSGGGGASGGW